MNDRLTGRNNNRVINSSENSKLPSSSHNVPGLLLFEFEGTLEGAEDVFGWLSQAFAGPSTLRKKRSVTELVCKALDNPPTMTDQFVLGFDPMNKII